MNEGAVYITRFKPRRCAGQSIRIRALSGSGGYGVVYEAEDLKLPGKRWAVKEVRAEPLAGEQLIREAEMLTRLHHRCLPRIVDYFPPDANGIGYLVTDYIDGETLSERFAVHQHRMSVEQAVRIAIELCRCFQYLHGLSPPIIYRDLKPSNVMLDKHGQVYLIDFGIARHYKRSQEADTLPLGTAAFAAPEQLEGRQTDERTDLYSLGAMLYYLLSGGHYVQSAPLPLTRLASDTPPRLVAVIEKLLAKTPEDRYQSAVALEQDLIAVFNELPHVSHAASAASRYLSQRAKNQMWDEVSASHPDRRSQIVIIGSLFPGAGTSFTAVALARVLNKLGVEHAVAEYPGLSPELFHWLDGERQCPDRYRFVQEQLKMDSVASEPPPKMWRDGKTIWYPLHPDRLESFERAADVYRWLEALSSPLILVDLSHGWDLPGVRELCRQAELLLWVADAHPGKFNGIQARQQVAHAAEWRRAGKKVHFVANRVLDGKRGRDWLNALPWPPLCTLPLADERDLYEDYPAWTSAYGPSATSEAQSGGHATFNPTSS